MADRAPKGERSQSRLTDYVGLGLGLAQASGWWLVAGGLLVAGWHRRAYGSGRRGSPAGKGSVLIAEHRAEGDESSMVLLWK